MNIYWEENDYSGKDKKPEFEVNKKVNLTEALMGNTETAYATTSILTSPPSVGGYDITGGNGMVTSTDFNFVKKPNWFHRTCCRFFLGWKWQDKKEEKENKQMLLG